MEGTFGPLGGWVVGWLGGWVVPAGRVVGWLGGWVVPAGQPSGRWAVGQLARFGGQCEATSETKQSQAQHKAAMHSNEK